MDFIKQTIMEDSWVLYLIDEDDDVTLEGDLRALIKFEQKEIYFKPDGLTLNIVMHELIHLYLGYTYIDDADLNSEQTEEVCASLFADRGESIVIKAKDIYNKLKQLRDGV